MKHMSFAVFIIFLTILFSGCATTTSKTISFKNSNAYFLRENIKKINIDELTENIKKNDNIILVSIETENTNDNYLNATIEDVILEKLVSKGYNVLERDNDLIYRLISESDNNYTHYLKSKRKLYMKSAPSESFNKSNYDLHFPFAGINNSHYMLGYNIFEKENFNERKIRTKLMTADKILAYRVIENGIVYEDEDRAVSDSLKRVANIVLSFRIEDAKTGKILSLKNIEQSSIDVISNKDKELIEKFHYRYYPFSYPNIYGNPSQTKYRTESKLNSPKKGLIILASASVAFIILMAVK